VTPPHDRAQKAGRGRRGIGRLSLAFAVTAVAIAVFADASAQAIRPNINISPRINPVTPRINTPNVQIGPRINLPPRVNIPRPGQPTGIGTVPINPRYVAPQVDVDVPPPRRRLPKKLVKKPPDGGSPPPRNLQGDSARRNVARVPSVQGRFVPDEVLIEIAGIPSQQAIDALARRHRLIQLESQYLGLINATWLRLRITGGRSVGNVTRRLATEPLVRAFQTNNLFKTSQQGETAGAAVTTPGDPVQYMIAKLRLAQAHGLAKGDKVLVAVIDSGIDDAHPELKDVIVGRLDTLDKPEKPHSHGTAIAGAIAAQARLMGVAPRSHILGIRAFGAASEGAESTTFRIVRGINWAVEQGARVINMSFAGPSDPGMARILAAAHGRGIVLIAAAGNAGPKSPPLFPAADPNVIAVTATDADDKLFPASNRGRHITLAAPGVEIFLPMPNGRYDFISGTSFAAAHVSGVVALILERKPDLRPDDVRKILVATAKDLGPKGRDDQFGAGLTDAFQAISILEPGKFQASGAAER
jgi:subtilisin family serine protease